MCVRKKSKQLFYDVKSSSSSPGAPGIKADFTPDRNKHLKKNDRPSSYLGFVGLSLLLFPSNMHVQFSQQFCLVPLVIFLISPYCTLLSQLILAIWRIRVIYDSSKEWVCSLYIPRMSETQRASEDRVLAGRIEGHRVLDSPTIAINENCCILIKFHK